MLKARETRAAARSVLRGNWLQVIVAVLIASLFSAGLTYGGSFGMSLNFNTRNLLSDSNTVNFDWEDRYSAYLEENTEEFIDMLREKYSDEQLESFLQKAENFADNPSAQSFLTMMQTEGFLPFLGFCLTGMLKAMRFPTLFFVFFLLVALLIGIVQYCICAPIQYGLCAFLMNVTDGKGSNVGDVFCGFRHFGKALLCQFLQSLYLFLWSLPSTVCALLGIVCLFRAETFLFAPALLIISMIYNVVITYYKTYSYKMSFFVLADDAGVTANGAITRSKELMNGYKWKLFCLELSFIGWAFLCLFTCGIGFVVLSAYTAVSTTVFYRTLVTPPTVLEQDFTPSAPQTPELSHPSDPS